MTEPCTTKFLERYGTKGASLLIERIVQDWLDLDVNSDPSNPGIVTAREILDMLIPNLEDMLVEQANRR